MEPVRFIREKNSFSILVQPPGWSDQNALLGTTTITFLLAAFLTYFVFRGFFINSLYAIPLWVIGCATFALAFQRAYLKLIFFVDAQTLTVASAGPLHRSIHRFPRASLKAAIVGNSKIISSKNPWQQLQLFFTDRTTPYCLLPDRDPTDLAHIARHLTEQLHLSSDINDPRYFELRYAPIHEKSFKLLCAIGVAVGFFAFAFHSTIGDNAMIIIFFIDVPAVLFISIIVMRTCRCPNCNSLIKRDNLSPEGYYQYTCPTCRIVWQSPIRIGGRYNH